MRLFASSVNLRATDLLEMRSLCHRTILELIQQSAAMRLMVSAHTYIVDIKGNILSSTIQALAREQLQKGAKINKLASLAVCCDSISKIYYYRLQSTVERLQIFSRF